MAFEPTHLGQSSGLPASPQEAVLDYPANPHSGTLYLVRFVAPEFTSLCPVTGQPDSCHLTITYVPDEKCVETKSLKYYLASYRNYPAFNEQIVNRITDDLAAAISPRWLKVEGRFSPRGGIQLTAMAEHNPENRPL